MRKSDKKTDNQLRLVLTQVCEVALKDIQGFQWLTHTANYNNFPQSLKVVCVFDSNESLDSYRQSQYNYKLVSLIKSELEGMQIRLKNIEKHITYDSEENCERQHNGNWAARLS